MNRQNESFQRGARSVTALLEATDHLVSAVKHTAGEAERSASQRVNQATMVASFAWHQAGKIPSAVLSQIVAQRTTQHALSAGAELVQRGKAVAELSREVAQAAALMAVDSVSTVAETTASLWPSAAPARPAREEWVPAPREVRIPPESEAPTAETESAADMAARPARPGAKKKPAAKAPAEKKPVAKKPAAKAPAEKKPVAKKPAAKAPAAKKPVAKKPAARPARPTAKKPAQ